MLTILNEPVEITGLQFLALFGLDRVGKAAAFVVQDFGS